MKPIVELREDVDEIPAGDLYHFADFQDTRFYIRRKSHNDFVLLRFGQEKGSLQELILKLEAMPENRDDCLTLKTYLQDNADDLLKCIQQ